MSSLARVFLGLVLVTACAGPPGEAGPAGTNGAMGAMGTMGTMGTIGAPGATGELGSMGTMGATGVTGTIGPAGPSGVTGPAGQPGANGTVAARDLIAKVVAYRSSILDVVCTSNATHGTGTKTMNGQIITAAHVMAGCTAAEYYGEGILVGAGGAFAPPVANRDLTIIGSINWTAFGLLIPGVPAWAGYTPSIGEATVLASYPATILSDIQFSLGLVTDDNVVNSLPADFPTSWSGAFQTDSAGGQGSSGGPMFNQAGQWVAILVGQWGADGVAPLVDLRILIPIRFQ